MNVIKKVLLGVVSAIVLLAVIGLLLPGTVHVERSITISAPPEKIYEQVGTLKTWKEWTAWNPAAYPKMSWTYAGPESGVGAELMWDDPSGKGHLKITEANPRTGIVYGLSFDGGKPIPGQIKFTPEGQATKVVWAFDNKSGWNPIERYFCFFVLDSLVGADFEKGLQGLKKTVEAAASAPPPPANNPESARPAETPAAKNE